ncbi:MAG: TRAP transporter substrate-binding protein [Spirochaetes bacterium]|nr:TRAP transporter substrate-binding protein [Spirochaetota bacterium]
MISKIKLIYIFVISIFIFTLALQKDEKKLMGQEIIKLGFSHGFPADHTMQVRVFEPWAKEISRLSKGRVEILFFPDGTLGKMPDQYKLAEDGVIDISYAIQDYTPDLFPLTTVFELPFMTPSAEKASRTMWLTYEKFAEFRNEYNKVKVLALFCHPGRHFYSISKPIKEVKDFKGIIFTTTNSFATNVVRIFGANPVPMTVADTYAAMENGIVGGTVVSWEELNTFKLDRFINYATEVYFNTMAMMVVMNKKKYNSLPKDIQKLIDNTTGLGMSVDAGKSYDDVEISFRNLAEKKGIKRFNFSGSDMEKLESFTLPLRRQWVKNMEKKGLPGQAILQEATVLHEIFKLNKKW